MACLSGLFILGRESQRPLEVLVDVVDVVRMLEVEESLGAPTAELLHLVENALQQTESIAP